MTNKIERIDVEGGTVEFDHSTGVMRAHWENGYHETWSGRGYSLDTNLRGFLLFTDQFDRLSALN